MGVHRPRTADVARRIAAAIALVATLMVGLVTGAGAAAAQTTAGSAAATDSSASAVASPGASLTARDLIVATGSALRGDDDGDATWAEPATVSVLLAEPVAFFVGLADTSAAGTPGRRVAQQRGRSPPLRVTLAPR
jgi:hypothetical protein